MPDKHEEIDISEKIANQIAEIVRESIKVDAEIIAYLKQDYEEIRRIAREQNISSAKLALMVLDGIRKGLVRGGIASLEVIKKILGVSKVELERLAEAWEKKQKSSG
ncbi:hypothetical protein [Hydrogenimonas sp. SS33]|uniref:hypothetical protein n=1 Tax=Hydrogenimonas leucolamina TaxID=2954236 RepID=UPI00336BC8EF